MMRYERIVMAFANRWTAQPGTNIARLDVMFLPLVGWDQEGTRLGMGAGYYDRALASARPGVLVGLGYDCQESDACPENPGTCHWTMSLPRVG